MDKKIIDTCRERLNLLETRVNKYGVTTPNFLELLDVTRTFIHEVSEDLKDPVKLNRKKLLRENLTNKELELVDAPTSNDGGGAS